MLPYMATLDLAPKPRSPQLASTPGFPGPRITLAEGAARGAHAKLPRTGWKGLDLPYLPRSPTRLGWPAAPRAELGATPGLLRHAAKGAAQGSRHLYLRGSWG